MKAIALHTVVPVRTQPSEQAEQQTQMLFAQTCEVTQELPRWLCVTIDDDGQIGWCDRKMLTMLSEQEYNQFIQSNRQAVVKFPIAYAVSQGNAQTFPLTAGTRLPDYDNGHFSVLGSKFQIDPQMVSPQPLELTKDNFLAVTRFFLNTPYLWGGKNALGLDCSGFTQVIMSIFGRNIKRNASEQALQGELVPFLSDAQCADLAFFGKTTEDKSIKITHVGFLLDKNTILHCSGRVKVEKIDSNGIINQETGNYSHDLVVIKRFSESI